MKIRSGSTELLAEQAPQVIPDRKREGARIIKRLQRIIAAHVEASAKIKCPLGLPDLMAVISALEAEADGLNPASHLTTGEEISTYLRSGVYEELVAEPSNIFHTTKVSDEVVRYEAVPRDFWKECLGQLRKGLTAPQK